MKLPIALSVITLKTPVLFIVYNRLDTTREVLSKIKKATPEKIYIAGDGPKENDETDKSKVYEVREYILENIDWDTELQTLFHKKNIGVKNAVSKGLKWFFSNEEKGIILEDDCLPADGFFQYCEELLAFYEEDKRIGMITGRNELGKYDNGQEGDYFLSTRGFVWGWATWKNRIEKLDVDIAQKITIRDIFTIFRNTSSFLEFVYRLNNIKRLRVDNLDTWDYQWSICMLLDSKYTLVPKKNMIKNIGFGDGATHVFSTSIDDTEVYENQDDLQHPEKLSSEKNFTYQTVKKHTGGLIRILIPRFLVKFVRQFK